MLLLHVGEMAVVCGGGSEASILQKAGRKNQVWLVVLAWCSGGILPAGLESSLRQDCQQIYIIIRQHNTGTGSLEQQQ